MSRIIGLFVDIPNLYSQILKEYGSRRLDYKKYYDFVADLGKIEVALAYGCQKNREAEGFRSCLESIGYKTKFKRPRMYKSGTMKVAWNVTLTLDIVNKIDHINCLILGSSNKELAPVLEWCRENAVLSIVIACGVGGVIQSAADKVIEIPESLLDA